MRRLSGRRLTYLVQITSSSLDRNQFHGKVRCLTKRKCFKAVESLFSAFFCYLNLSDISLPYRADLRWGSTNRKLLTNFSTKQAISTINSRLQHGVRLASNNETFRIQNKHGNPLVFHRQIISNSDYVLRMCMHIFELKTQL